MQCHPHVCGADFNEVRLIADFELAESMVTLLRGRSVAVNVVTNESQSEIVIRCCW